MNVEASLCGRCGRPYWRGPAADGFEAYCRDCKLALKRTRLDTDHEYGSLWPRRRLEAKRRDGWQCQECEIRQTECRQAYGVGLHVHHVEPYESFEDDGEAHALDNLETLCPSCHARRET